MPTKNQLQKALDECRANRATDKATISSQADQIAGLKLALADCEGTEPPPPEPPPTGSWRPFAADSLFNVPIPSNPPLDPNSAAICATYAADHPSPGFSPTDGWSHPIYWAKPTDPEHTITLREAWGTSTQGMKIRIPVGAKPEGAGVSPADSHISVVQPDGMCYDFWSDGFKNVRTVIEPGKITASWGGRGRIDGDSLNMGATAARYGLAAGNITGDELKAGQINHALFCVTKSGTNGLKKNGAVGKSVYNGKANLPAMGQRLRFEYTDAEIAAITSPWQRTVIRALVKYGMFVGDNGGGFVKPESQLTVYPDGGSGELLAYARSLGLSSFSVPVNWSRMRALA